MASVGPWAISVYKDKVNWGVVPVPTAAGMTADKTHTFSDAKNIGMYASCTNQGTAGAMVLSADDPAVVLARTKSPLLSAQTEQERTGIVPNVVFPTAMEDIDGQLFVFYGMADSRIGVAALDRTGEPS